MKIQKLNESRSLKEVKTSSKEVIDAYVNKLIDSGFEIIKSYENDGYIQLKSDDDKYTKAYLSAQYGPGYEKSKIINDKNDRITIMKSKSLGELQIVETYATSYREYCLYVIILPKNYITESWSPVEYDEETGEYYSRPGNEFDGIDPQNQPIEEARMYRDPYGINDIKRLLNNKAPEAWWGREEIEMDFGDGSKLANYLTKKGIDVKYHEEDEVWFVKGQYHFNDCYFYPYPYRYENELNEGLQYIENINSRKGIRQLKESTDKFSIFIDTDQEPDRDILLDANSLEDAKQKANELSKKHGGYKVIVNDSNHKQIYCARRGRACESLIETYYINDEEVMNKVAELGKELESQGFKYVSSKDSRDYYDFYRKIENGKGIWKAVIYNYGAAEIIDVTYEQARGIKPIDSLEQLRKDLGKMLLPNNSINEALGRDYSHIPEVKQINYSNNKNGNLLPYLDCNRFKTALEETGLEAFKIKSARLKGVSLADLEDEFGGRGMQPWKWTHDFDSSIPIGDGNEFDIFWKGEFPKVEEKLQNEKEDASEEKEDAKLNESEDGWVKRFNWADKYYKDDYVISAIPGYPDSTKTSQWHVEKVRPNGTTVSHLGNYSSLDKAKEVVDALPSKKLSEDIEVPTLEGPNEGAEYGLSELLNSAIQHELETVNEYNVLALNARAEGYDDIASVIDEINTEENKHIGQLQEVLKTISPNAHAIVVGETEASDDLVNVEVE